MTIPTPMQAAAQLTAPGAPFELIDVERGGTSLKAFRNAPASLAQVVARAAAHGAAEFLVCEGERWSFARFHAAVEALAGALHTELGVQPGEVVAIAMRNRPEWALAFAAVARLGAVPAPLNSMGLRESLVHALEQVRPRVLIADGERLARVAADLPALGITPVVTGDAAGGGVVALEALIEKAITPPPLPECDPDSTALILFTSGSSSHAKAAVSSHRAVCQALFNIDFVGAISAMTSPQLVAAMMAAGNPPTTLLAVPLFHVSGLHAQLLTALRHGRRLVILPRWNPATALELIRAERITGFNGAPAQVRQLVEQPGFDDPAVTGSLSAIGFGGAGLPPSLINAVLAHQPRLMTGIGFGLTESNGVGAALSGEAFAAAPQASGLVSPIAELRLLGDDGAVVAPGEAGEICLRSVCLMAGYLGDPAASAAALAGGWLHTGDVGRIDADGLLQVVDRIKDQINRSGEKIAAAEVEACLIAHPAVAEAAVIAAPDEASGEVVVAVVVPRPGMAVSSAELIEFVAQHLGRFKAPARVHLRAAELPRTASGKLQKTGLRSDYR